MQSHVINVTNYGRRNSMQLERTVPFYTLQCSNFSAYTCVRYLNLNKGFHQDMKELIIISRVYLMHDGNNTVIYLAWCIIFYFLYVQMWSRNNLMIKFQLIYIRQDVINKESFEKISIICTQLLSSNWDKKSRYISSGSNKFINVLMKRVIK